MPRIFITVAVGFLIFTAASPLFLIPASQIPGVDWAGLGQISQAYGLASAILAALGLAGIAASVYYQSQQTRAQLIYDTRSTQLELLQILLEKPELYGPCVSPAAMRDLAPDEFRQHLFITLMLNYARMGYEAGTLAPELVTDEILAGVFEGEIGRNYWSRVRPIWQMEAARSSGPRARFVALTEKAFNDAARRMAERPSD
jgi:hypothetical protein